MNIKPVIALAAFTLATGLASASEATQFEPNPSTASRQAVRAELARAQAAGELENHGESYGYTAYQPSTKSGITREAVVAELNRARANGELDNRGDTYGSFKANELKSTLTRAEVRAQAFGGGLSRGNYSQRTGG
jgi:hypothetical protein